MRIPVGLGVLLALAASTASAAESEPARVDPVGTASTAEVAPAHEGVTLERREVPNYDGREAPPVSPGEVLLAVPRLVLFPAYLVSEYALRRPLAWVTTNAEKNDWPGLLLDFFTFDEDRRVGVLPIFLVDLGFRPIAGLYFFWNDLLVDRHQLRLQATTGGARSFSVRLADRYTFDDASKLEIELLAVRAPDFIFDGIGPNSDDDVRARYAADQLDGTIGYEILLNDSGHLSVFAGIRAWRQLSDAKLDQEDRSIADRVNEGAYLTPPSGDGAYSIYRHGVSLGWDTRASMPAPGDGIRLEAYATHSFELTESLERGWLSYGASAGGFFDVSGNNRNLALSLETHFVDPLGDLDEMPDGVPFTELAGLGGLGVMRGFRPGAIIGRSAAALTLEYRYPVWVFFDGSAHVSVGNAFGEHLEGFDPKDLRMSFGLGIRSIGRRDRSFNVLVAFGTETFRDGADIDTFRLVVGTNRGF